MLVDLLKAYFQTYRSPRYRAQTTFYASSLTKDMRDLYWELTGEPQTDPYDATSGIRMLLGSAFEYGIMNWAVNHLHIYGLHTVPSQGQIEVGGKEPVTWTGKLDGLVIDDKGKKYAVEIKTKYGYGANLFTESMDPGANYLAQMGAYLKCLSENNVTNEGLFLFCLIGDRNFGELVQIRCKYENGIVTAYEGQTMQSGEVRPLSYSLNMNEVFERLVKVQEYVTKGELPPVDKVYKHALTDSFLASLKDSEIMAALKGEKVLGDWEIKYSPYKTKHLTLQGGPGYTEFELKQLAQEYKKRVPRSPIAAKILKG